MSDLRKTPLHDRHKALSAKFAPFAGWDMPIQYTSGIIAEHLHTRQAAGLFDICHMGEYFLEGPGAAEALGKALTVNLATLKPGRCRYGFLLTDKGGIHDDLIVYRLKEDSFMIVVNAACRESDFAMIGERLPKGLKFADASDEIAKLDLQGPESVSVLEGILPQGHWRRLPYFGFTEDSFDGGRLLVSRTGYTGELGFELYVPWGKAAALWDLCLTDPRVKPAGLGARDTLRLEVGLPLNGHDIDESHTPAEAGYGGLLTSQDAYVGKEGAHEVREKLIGLSLAGRRSAREGDAILDASGQKVGVVTSGSFAPSLGKAIALGYVRADSAQAAGFIIKTSREEIQAEAAELPFYKQGTARAAIL